MITPHVACLVRRWVSLYTYGLAPDVRDRRREEVAADLWSQVEESHQLGRSDGSTSVEMVVRLIAGLPADLTWRMEQASSTPVPDSAPGIGGGSPATAGAAIVGALLLSVALLVFLATLPTMSPSRSWADPVIGMIMVLAASGGMLGLSLATLGLVIRYQGQLHGGVAIIGAIAFLAGFLAALGPYQLIAVLVIGSAVLAWDLASIGVLGRRLAIGHIWAALAFVVLVVGGTAAGVMGVLALAYPITWVFIGLAVLRGPAIGEIRGRA